MQISPSSAQAASIACNELLSCAMSSHDKTQKLHREIIVSSYDTENSNYSAKLTCLQIKSLVLHARKI